MEATEMNLNDAGWLPIRVNNVCPRPCVKVHICIGRSHEVFRRGKTGKEINNGTSGTKGNGKKIECPRFTGNYYHHSLIASPNENGKADMTSCLSPFSSDPVLSFWHYKFPGSKPDMISWDHLNQIPFKIQS